MDCITIDGAVTGTLDKTRPLFAERPDGAGGPVWVLCEVLLACGRVLSGGVRVTPPGTERGAVPHAVPSGLIANVEGADIDILSGSERARASLLAHQVLPLRIRLATASPIPVTGMHDGMPGKRLEPGEWSRPLSQADMCCDTARLGMPGFAVR